MTNTLRTTMLRDRKEQEIDAIYSSIATSEASRVHYQHTLDRVKANYSKWLAENDINGIKYK